MNIKFINESLGLTTDGEAFQETLRFIKPRNFILTQITVSDNYHNTECPADIFKTMRFPYVPTALTLKTAFCLYNVLTYSVLSSQ
jgi:hypothetical protein